MRTDQDESLFGEGKKIGENERKKRTPQNQKTRQRQWSVSLPDSVIILN